MNFNKLVKEYLSPTLRQFGFEVVDDFMGFITFKNDEITVILSYDHNSSYEVDMVLCFGSYSICYGYSELNELFNSEQKLSATQICNTPFLVRWLEEIDIFLRSKLEYVLSNTQIVHKALQVVQQRRLEILEKEQDQGIRGRLDELWQSKDYVGFIRHMREYGGHLEGSIEAKYKYALKMINKKHNA
ncbi:hypothetical protein [Pedobacter faecalis]|uniref:hypothetical protein n=1 Tax=Pedobacter faecalis TaxID=3041495 RepID=UPI00254D5813|nr:hypothetical protein [Pedobacter sp. ELA7]